jgi:uncharacterized 2Fe-2S/4Fe-4S cluster protein (DUF4445 family)
LHNGRVKIGNQDPEAYRQRLEAKLRPERIRATLGFAGLYRMTHELIKAAVLDEVHEFYWRGIVDGAIVYDEQAYAENVLARAPQNKFRASLLWLVEDDAITLAQADWKTSTLTATTSVTSSSSTLWTRTSSLTSSCSRMP